MNEHKFAIGQLVATPGIMELVEAGEDVIAPLLRHAQGDWGNVCTEDAASNDEAVKQGSRLLSSYDVSGTKIWIITDTGKHQSVTTLLLPSEY